MRALCIRLPRELLSADINNAAAVLQDVTAVVDTCHAAGISKKAVKLRPIAVVKG